MARGGSGDGDGNGDGDGEERKTSPMVVAEQKRVRPCMDNREGCWLLAGSQE